MGLFSFTQEVAIDLGTANTIITCNDKMVVDEPSVIALDARSDKVLAVGKVAREMYEKTHPNIRTVRPLREGVIADFYAAEQMIRGFIKMASGRKRWFAPSLRMVIGIPSGSTEVEIRAVRDSAEHAQVYILPGIFKRAYIFSQKNLPFIPLIFNIKQNIKRKKRLFYRKKINE